MDVIGLFVAIAFFTMPVTCWALLSRTPRLRRIVGAVIATCLIAELLLLIVLDQGRLQVALWAAFAFLSLAAIATGVVIESRGSLRSWLAWKRWLGRKGLTACGLALVYAIGCAIFLVFAHSTNQLSQSALRAELGYAPASAPADSVVLPLGSGLVVTSDTTTCAAVCLRELDVRSTTGLSEQATLALIRSRLTQLHGWHLTMKRSQWSGCLPEGTAARPWQLCATLGLFDVGGTTAEPVIDLQNAAASR